MKKKGKSKRNGKSRRKTAKRRSTKRAAPKMVPPEEMVDVGPSGRR